MSRALVWQPDYWVKSDIKDFKPNAKFYPETMSAGVKRLVRTWAELCRWVFVQLGSDAEYGVGVIFSNKVGAQYLADGDEKWLFFNPYRKRWEKDLLDPTDEKDLSWLYAAAIHECTHMANGVFEHDEDFSSALTSNIARTISSISEIKRIARFAARAVKS